MTVSTPTTSADPSMDEILASIRRMLKEDDQNSANKPDSPALDANTPPSPELGNVIALDASMLDPTTNQSAAPEPAPSAPPAPAEAAAPAKVADFQVPSFEAFEPVEPAKSTEPSPTSSNQAQSGPIGDDGLQAAILAPWSAPCTVSAASPSPAAAPPSKTSSAKNSARCSNPGSTPICPTSSNASSAPKSIA